MLIPDRLIKIVGTSRIVTGFQGDFPASSIHRTMIPDSVRKLEEIERLNGDQRLIHAVSLLDFLVAVSPDFKRNEMESLGAVINRHRDRFPQIANLNFALGLRNKIIHPRPTNAGDPDMTPAAVRAASDYVIDAIAVDVAPYAPEEVRAALLADWDEDEDDDGVETRLADIHVAGWRYEAVQPSESAALSRSAWQAPMAVEDAAVDNSPHWLATAATSLRSTNPVLFWGGLSFIPLALLVALPLGSKLSSFLPGNLLVQGAVLFLVVSAARWLRGL